MHEHGFNWVTAVCERPQELDGVTLVAHTCGGEVQRIRESVSQFFAHSARQRKNLRRFGKLCVQTFPNLLQAECWLAAKESCNVFTCCIVKTGHAFSLEVLLCQLLVIEHASTKNIKTRGPECNVGDINAESLAEFLCRIHSRARQHRVVVFTEMIRV